jgi:hypothetical protein
LRSSCQLQLLLSCLLILPWNGSSPWAQRRWAERSQGHCSLLSQSNKMEVAHEHKEGGQSVHEVILACWARVTKTLSSSYLQHKTMKFSTAYPWTLWIKLSLLKNSELPTCPNGHRQQACPNTPNPISTS